MCAQMSKSCGIIFNNPKSKHSNDKKRTKTKKTNQPTGFHSTTEQKSSEMICSLGSFMQPPLCTNNPRISEIFNYYYIQSHGLHLFRLQTLYQTSWFWCTLVGALCGEGAERGAGTSQVWTVSSHKWGSRAPFPDTVLSEDRRSTFFFFLVWQDTKF